MFITSFEEQNITYRSCSNFRIHLCVVVERFAVDQAAQGQGVGKVLLAHALKQVSKVAQIIGVNFVVIHAKDQKAMKFYQRFGFISLTSNPLTLIYPVNEIPHFK